VESWFEPSNPAYAIQGFSARLPAGVQAIEHNIAWDYDRAIAACLSEAAVSLSGRFVVSKFALLGLELVLIQFHGKLIPLTARHAARNHELQRRDSVQ
jgi:hypothetical protein